MAVLRRATLPYRNRSARMVPVTPMELDRSHPLATGLFCFYVPGLSNNDFANNMVPIYPSVYDYTCLVNGSCGSGVGGRAFYNGVPGQLLQPLNGVRWTLWTFFTQYDNSNNIGPSNAWPARFGILNGSNYIAQGLECIFTYTDRPHIGVVIHQGFNWYDSRTPPPLRDVTFGVTLDQYGNPGLLAFDGVDQGWNSPSGGGGGFPYYNPGVTYCISMAAVNNIIAYSGAIWTRALSADELKWLGAEPFAMLRPIVRRIYSLPSSTVIVTPPSTIRPRITMISL